MRKEKGFTLIELLVVVAIIGILAAIAIPQFQEYRKRGYDAGAKSDLRNAANGAEAYFVDHNEYPDCTTAATCVTALPGLSSVSSTVAMALTGTTTSFTGTAAASSGSGATYQWNSENGGLQ